jgi:class 3 adenylate cyclase
MIATWAMTRVFPVEEGDRRPPTAFWPGWLLVTWGTLLALHGVYVWARRGAPAGAPGWASDRGPGRIVATVLFTDIVESTRLAAELGDRRWGELLERHDRRARRLIERFGGWMVKTLGDGLLAIFRTPQDAILSAAALRDDLATDGIEIRVGVHTGEVDLREGDVGGIGVHIAARVMSAAGASEILASRTVRDLVAGSEIAFADRGLHRLKGVDGEWQLFSVARVGSSG